MNTGTLSRIHSRLGLVFLTGLSSLLCSADASWAPSDVVNAGGPVIRSATAIQPAQTQTITITGKGFGTQSGYDGNSAYLSILDVTGAWEAGDSHYNDVVTVDVKSWADNQIVIGGFTGQYGGGGGEWQLKKGDVIVIYVGDPTKQIPVAGWKYHAAPGVCIAVVGSGHVCKGPH
jgi:hypothetical protein